MSEHKEPIPSRIYNASIGGHIAGADDIIDDKSGLTLDELVGNKDYNIASHSGMGRITLKKNIVDGVNTLTQNMINKTNTIYVIQYDFTLGEDITVPANCVLEFKGGGLSDGTINSDDVEIFSDKCCIFHNISFIGKCIYKRYLVEWFVSNYTDSIDKTKDATSELQAMFNSGVRHIHVSNDRFYYITSTINIDSNVIITGESSSYTMITDLPSGRQRPCFYTSGDVIPFKINVLSGYPVKIENLYGYRVDALHTYDNHKEDIPFISIYAKNAGARFSEIDVYLECERVDSVINGHDVKSYGYTGIEIKADGSTAYFNSTTIKGIFYNLYRCINVQRVNGGTTTNVHCNFNSNCVRGGDINGDATIYGTHQTLVSLSDSNYSYFRCSLAAINGFVWDLGSIPFNDTPNLHSANFAVDAPKIVGARRTEVYPNTERLQSLYDDNFYKTRFTGLLNYNNCGNLLEQAFYNAYRIMTDHTASYGSTASLFYNRVTCKLYRTTDNEEVSVDITEDIISNYDNLFRLNAQNGGPAFKDYVDNNGCYIKDGNIYTKYEVTFLNISRLNSVLVGYICEAARSDCNVTVYIGNEEYVLDSNYISNYSFKEVYGIKADVTVKIIATSTFDNRHPLPKLAILSSNLNQSISSSGGYIGGLLVMGNNRFINSNKILNVTNRGWSTLNAGKRLLYDIALSKTDFTDVICIDSFYTYTNSVFIEGYSATTYGRGSIGKKFLLHINVGHPTLGGTFGYAVNSDLSFKVYYKMSSSNLYLYIQAKTSENYKIISITSITAGGIAHTHNKYPDDLTSWTELSKVDMAGDMKWVSNKPYWYDGSDWRDANGNVLT